MAVDPNPQIYSATSTGEITAINYGTGDAGTYEPGSSGTEYHIWNDRGGVLDSSKMTSVKITVRDADGDETDNITTQHWVEVKSTTIVAGAASTGGGSSGDLTGVTDDNMPEFQAIGKDNYAILGDIPANCYRIILVRVNIPTNAIQAGVTFSLYVTNQQPSTPITKWITRDKFNAIVPTTGDPFAMSTGGTTGTIPYNDGTALINSNEVYYGSSGSYDITTTGSGTYNIYLGESGVLSGTTGALTSNQLSLYAATYSSGICTALIDKRVYLVGFLAGSSGAIPEAPLIKGSMFFDFNNGILSGVTSTGWKTLTT